MSFRASTTQAQRFAQSDGSAALRLDGFAADCLARLEPIRFAIATSEQEQADTFRLRYRAVVERGWAAPADFPDGMEREPDDERAVHIGGWNGNEPIAAGRLIFPIPGSPMPIERVFGVIVEPLDQVVQVDRLTVRSDFRGHGSRYFFGLVCRCWIELRQRGFSICVGTETESMLRLWGRFGFSKVILASPRDYWGEKRYPVRFEPNNVVPDLAERALARI